MQRFAKKLSTYNYDIKYRPEKENFTPDLLLQAQYLVDTDLTLAAVKELAHA